MGYRRAEQILPTEIIALIQEYVDGECIYIPRKEGFRKSWGEGTDTRSQLEERDRSIFSDHSRGISKQELARRYYLSEKSIERIVRKMKKERGSRETA